MHLNTTSNNHTEIFSPLEKRSIYIGYLTVSIVGILSNSIVCYLIIRYKYLQKVVNLLILNLAISDIIAGISVYPYVFLDVQTSYKKGDLANFLCGFSEGLSTFFIAASVSLLTLSILSISRYLVINHPLKLSWRLEKRNMKWIFAFVWLVSTALLLPSALSFSFNEEKKFCVRHWAPGVHPMTYFVATGILGFIIPLFSLAFTYVTTLYTLWLKKDILIHNNSGSRLRDDIRLKKRVISLLGMLLFVYLICWIPFAIYWLLSVPVKKYTGSIEKEIEGMRVTKVCIFIALCNTVLNPMIYAFSNRQLRRTFLRSFKHKRVDSITHLTTFNAASLTTHRRRYTFSVSEYSKPRLSVISDTFRARDMTM